MSINTTIEKFLPGLWFSLDTLADDIPEFVEGDLVEWTRYDDENEIGIGIIKHFSNQRFYDYDAGEYVNLPCAYVVNANPADPYGYYIPMTHMDEISLSDYMMIYKENYEADLLEMSVLRLRVASSMQKYGWQRGQGNVSELRYGSISVQVQGIPA